VVAERRRHTRLLLSRQTADVAARGRVVYLNQDAWTLNRENDDGVEEAKLEGCWARQLQGRRLPKPQR
jgi:hypothetical protein